MQAHKLNCDDESCHNLLLVTYYLLLITYYLLLISYYLLVNKNRLVLMVVHSESEFCFGRR